MDILLVFWKIKPDMEKDFVEWWQGSLEKRPDGLVNEYLSKVEPDETSTWDVSSPKYVTYMGVGLWKDKSHWKKVFSGQSHLMPFEDSLRERVWLSAKGEH